MNWDELEECRQVHVVELALLEHVVNEWLGLVQHRGVRDVSELDAVVWVGGPLLVDVLLGVEERLQVPERVVDLQLGDVGLDPVLAAEHVALRAVQKRARLVGAARVHARIVAYFAERKLIWFDKRRIYFEFDDTH